MLKAIPGSRRSVVAELPVQERLAVEEARRRLRSVAPIPDADFEQVVYELAKTHAVVQGEALVNLIMEAALREWATGMKCC